MRSLKPYSGDNRFSLGILKNREFENGLVLITDLRVLSTHLVPHQCLKENVDGR